MDALLILVHGSPRPIANEDMFRVVERLKARADAAALFPIVEVGFMECNAPSIPEAIENCVKRGAERIRAVPYFLHTGNHVCEDLPTLLEEAQARYRDVIFLMGDYIGLAPAVTGLLAKRAEAGMEHPLVRGLQSSGGGDVPSSGGSLRLALPPATVSSSR